MSAYDIQKLVEYRNISKWVKISTPSIYKKAIQLEEKGLIRGEIVKEGKMPEKAIYSLTEAGEASPLAALRGAPVLHWHGDTFDLPPATSLLASTDITPHQAFQAGAGQLALQFHAEADAARMEHWLMGHACELAAARLDVAAIRQDARELGRRAAAAGQDFFRRWLAGVFTA